MTASHRPDPAPVPGAVPAAGVDQARRDLLWRHLSTARWFGGRGLTASLTALVELPWLTAADAPVAVRPEIVGVDFAGGATRFYQLLLAYRSASADPGPADAVLGRLDLPELGAVSVGDATRDPEAMTAVWHDFLTGAEHAGAGGGCDHRLLDTDGLSPDLTPRVFTGEQSNTSVMFGDRAMLKLFRRLELGRNLDIEVHAALSSSPDAARLYGWTEGRWTFGGAPVQADLAMVVEQLHGARDGWDSALEACAAGRPFTAEAAELGTALRGVHRALREHFPHRDVTGAATAAVMENRLDTAAAEAPALRPFVEPLRARFGALGAHTLAAQRVHGDFHLGQVLFTDTGPKIIDFEGEPLKTLAERVAPDSVWRDVAGLVRSFDYAAGSVRRDGATPAGDPAAWARDATRAFLDAYCGPLTTEQQTLLDAYVADKAVYEVTYELRNRPDWAAIPLDALAELVADPSARSDSEGTQPMAVDFAGGLTGQQLEGFHAGGDTEVWRRLGSHPASFADGDRRVQGTRFAVWAPNAQAVSVVGDFNDWSTDGDPMRLVPGSGVWAGFVADVGPGTVYKYRVLCSDGVWREKADPMAQFAEGPPATGSIVWESSYEWADDAWLERRAQSRPHAEPMSVYELHLPSWRKGLTYTELADQLVEYVTWQGYTHVEFMPLAQHPFEGSWGYQVTGYFAPYSPLGTPDEFRHLVDRLHQAGIGVLMDWVPGHFPKDEWALGRFDGTALYEHADPRQGEQLDWGTYVFNFGRNEVKSFLVSNALYWVQQFHIDGLRVDAVASMLYLDYSRPEGGWVPNVDGGNENYEAIDLLRFVNQHLYERVPGVVTVAEESTSFPGVTRPVHHGGLGFGFKWNMGWMNDSLSYLAHEPIYRQYHHHDMTFAMVYAFSENFVLPISHDEVVHGKGSMVNKVPGDDWQKFATLRAFYAFMWSHPGKQLVFAGCEFGQRAEFSEVNGPEWWVSELWGHGGLQRLFRDLNRLYRERPALWRLDNDPEGFRWIDADDQGGNTFSFVRSDGAGDTVVSVVNFSPEPHTDRRIGLPAGGTWRELLNTDAVTYDGTGQFANAEVRADDTPWNGFDASASITVPPMGAVWLVHQAAPED